MPLGSLINKLLRGEADEWCETDFGFYLESLTHGDKKELEQVLETVDEAMVEIRENDGIQRKGLVLKLINSLKQICNHPAQFMKSSNYNIRQGAERIALNTPIQGTAADLIKLAMIRVDEALREAFPEAKLLLQVHDELIVECPEEQAEGVAALISREMEAVSDLNVPLTAEAKIGKSWFDAK